MRSVSITRRPWPAVSVGATQRPWGEKARWAITLSKSHTRLQDAAGGIEQINAHAILARPARIPSARRHQLAVRRDRDRKDLAVVARTDRHPQGSEQPPLGQRP